MKDVKIVPDAEALGVDVEKVTTTEDDLKKEIGEWVMGCRHREKILRFMAVRFAAQTEKCARLEAELAEQIQELETALKLIPED